MTDRKGLTLIEIIVTLVIIGVLTAIAVPSYTNYIQQGAEKAVENNMRVIYGAQRNYYFNHGNYYYCPACGAGSDDLNGINSNLSLNIAPGSGYNYLCWPANVTDTKITCAGYQILGNSVTLNTDGSISCSPSPCP